MMETNTILETKSAMWDILADATPHIQNAGIFRFKSKAAMRRSLRAVKNNRITSLLPSSGHKQPFYLVYWAFACDVRPHGHVYLERKYVLVELTEGAQDAWVWVLKEEIEEDGIGRYRFKSKAAMLRSRRDVRRNPRLVSKEVNIPANFSGSFKLCIWNCLLRRGPENRVILEIDENEFVLAEGEEKEYFWTLVNAIEVTNAPRRNTK